MFWCSINTPFSDFPPPPSPFLLLLPFPPLPPPPRIPHMRTCVASFQAPLEPRLKRFSSIRREPEDCVKRPHAWLLAPPNRSNRRRLPPPPPSFSPTLPPISHLFPSIPIPTPSSCSRPSSSIFFLSNASLQLAALEAAVRDGDAYSALQRYKALFSRGKSNADDAIRILSSVSKKRLVCHLRIINSAMDQGSLCLSAHGQTQGAVDLAKELVKASDPCPSAVLPLIDPRLSPSLLVALSSSVRSRECHGQQVGALTL